MINILDAVKETDWLIFREIEVSHAIRYAYEERKFEKTSKYAADTIQCKRNFSPKACGRGDLLCKQGNKEITMNERNEFTMVTFCLKAFSAHSIHKCSRMREKPK